MPKFSNSRPARPRGPVGTTSRARTSEGGLGWLRDPKGELFVLAACNMVGEDTFYEAAEDRDDRFATLIHTVAASDPDWLTRFIPWLRDALNMRSASIVAAAEYVKAGAPNGRKVVGSAIVRADEPAEMLAYWMHTHGRSLPAALKRGVADAAVRLYSERNLLKYDGQSRGMRMADVIELVHPKPNAPWQSDLFSHALDRRHHPDNAPLAESLQMLRLDRELISLPESDRRDAFRNGRCAEAGWSWERLAGWLPGGMDKEAWEGIAPQMGYMALVRNLRNFDQADISPALRKTIAEKLADPDEVAKSRQFPFRFLSAYKATESIHWGPALEQALELSCRNIPSYTGRTLILIDISGSMQSPISARSKVQRYEVGALFGAALAKRGDKVDVCLFADSPVAFPVVDPSISVLRYCEAVRKKIGCVGYGTAIHESLRQMWDGHERVILVSDEAANDTLVGAIDKKIPTVHTVNLGGYRVATFSSGPGRYTYAGFSDASFEMMLAVERGANSDWPF